MAVASSAGSLCRVTRLELNILNKAVIPSQTLTNSKKALLMRACRAWDVTAYKP